ncbi:MAG: rhomboid family intramembrane serine protease [Deltaproteobacteria bacterium]|nr:rhomboid family intramembrane serine protease [Deltaproteobacteria bacterium]
MSRRQKFQFDREQLRITRGALILLFLEVGVSLVWLFLDPPAKARMASWIVPTGDSVWREGKVWTLVTGPLLETEFISLLLNGVVMWLFVPGLERWVGTNRFLRFAIYTAVAGTVAGTLLGLATDGGVPIVGLAPFTYAALVAYGTIYAKQPVQFFGVVPMTGRQLTIGISAFVFLFVLLQGAWERGAAYAAAMGLAVLLTNQKWNPRLAWLRYKKRRERAHLAVIDGGKHTPPKKPKPKGEQWLN